MILKGSNHKKRRLFVGAAILICLAVTVLILLLCNPGNRQKILAEPVSQVLLEASQGLDEITIDGFFYPDEKMMTVKQTMVIKNRWKEQMPELVLQTYANAFLLEDTSPAATQELFDLCYPEGFVPGGISFIKVLADGQEQSYQYEGQGKTLMVLPLKSPLEPEKTVTIELEYQLAIPNCAYRFGYGQNAYQLGNVFPTLAVYEQGAWRKEEYLSIGDPFYSHCANYTVSVNAPVGYVAAASSYGEEETKDGRVIYHYKAPAVRDFALTLSNTLLRWEKKSGTVVLSALAKDQKTAGQLLEYGEKALTCFNQLYGNYPYQQLSLVQANFPLGGMEYPGLVLISDQLIPAGKTDFEWTIAHEVAHQWWYGVVGSDQYYQPWQDEALCEYALLAYIKTYYGLEAKEDAIATRITSAMRLTLPQGITPGSPIDYFGNLTEYSLMVYRRGAMAFLTLEEALGEEELNRVLRAYYNRYAFKLASREDFEQTLADVTGQDWSALLVDFLDTQYVY